jgi:hypothetical protein
MMRFAMVLTTAGALLTLDFKSALLKLTEQIEKPALEGKLVLAEKICAEAALESTFLLLTEPPCKGIRNVSATRLYLIPAKANEVLRYENIVRSAISVSEFLWEVSISSNLDLEKTVLGLNIEAGDLYFPSMTSSSCPLTCRIASRRLDYTSRSEDDDCEEDDSRSSCERVSLPTWVSILLTLALCLG